MINWVINIFQQPLRPFFLYACLKAIFIPMFTVVIMVNDWKYAHPYFDDFIHWHQYEMLFSFLLSVVLGFSLTAFYRWNKQAPIHGRTLVLLFFSFLLSEAIFWIPNLNTSMALSINIIFSLIYGWIIFPPLKSAKRLLFIIPIGLILLLKSTGPLVDEQFFPLLIELGIMAFVTLVSNMLILLVPNFTNSFFQQGKIEINKKIKISMNVLILLSMGFLYFELSHLACLSLITFGLINLCIYSLFPLKESWKNKILYHLQLGFPLLGLGLIWFGLQQIESIQEFNFAHGAVHFLFTVGVSSILMNIMIRAGLGHTGMEVKLDKWTGSMLVLIFVGGVIRSVLPELFPDYYDQILHHGMGHWTLAFIFYFFYFAPKFTRKN